MKQSQQQQQPREVQSQVETVLMERISALLDYSWGPIGSRRHRILILVIGTVAQSRQLGIDMKKVEQRQQIKSRDDECLQGYDDNVTKQRTIFVWGGKVRRSRNSFRNKNN
jgi:hypothetical protein